jgi:hypothetical protein
MKNLLFNLQAVQTGNYKAEVGTGARPNSFGSTTLVVCTTTKIIKFNISSYTITHVCKGNTCPTWEKEFDNL